MAILRGQAAADYMSKNPQGSYSMVGAQSQQSGGFLKNLLAGATQPFRRLAEDATSIGKFFVDPNKPIEDQSSTFLSEEERKQRWQGNPLLEALKTGAGIGAYAMPGSMGGGVTGLMKGGAAGGALGGLGASEGGDLASVLGDVGKGALTGGALGGGLGVAGKTFGKLKGLGGIGEKGSNLRKGLLEIDASKIGSARKATQLKNQTFGILDDLKLNTTTKGNIANSIDDGLSQLGKQLDDPVVQAVNFQNGTDDILNTFRGKFKNNSKILKQGYSEEIMGDLIDLGDDPSFQQLMDFKTDLQGRVNWNRNVQSIPDRERVIREMEKVIDLKIQSHPQLSNVKPTLTKMSTLHKARPFALKAAGRQAQVGSPLLGAKIGVGGVTERLRSGAGKLLEKGIPGGGKLQNLLGDQTMQQFSKTGQKMIPLLGAQQSVQPQLGEPGDAGLTPNMQGLGGDVLGAQPGDMGGMGGEQPNLEGLQQMLALGVATGKMDPAQANSIISLLGMGDEGGASPESQGLMKAVDSMERAYGIGTPQSLSAGGTTTGLGGLLGKVGTKVKGVTDQGYQDRLTAYQGVRDIAMAMVNKARGAGTLNEGEARVMMESMPNENTSEEAARQWFTNIRTMLG